MATETRKPRAAKVAATRSIHQKELIAIHDICGQLKRLTESLGQEYNLRRNLG